MAERSGGNMRSLGRTGLAHYSGLVYEEQLRQLSGTKAVKTFAEMRDNDAVIGAVLFMIEMLIRQVRWEVVAQSEDASDKEAAQFVEECMDDMSHTWEDLIAEILSMLVFGWSYFEIVYKRRSGSSKDPTKRSRYTDNRIGWRKIEIRAQETLDKWDFDEDGGLRGLWQMPPPTYESLYIPIEKALLFRTKSAKANPEGRSILRNAFRSWYYKKRMEELEAIGMERDLAGLPVIEVPPEILMDDATAAQKSLKTQLEQAVSEVRRDEREGLLMPAEKYSIPGQEKEITTGYKFRLVTSGGQRQIDPDKTIRRLESRIALTVMAQFILLGQDKVGSFSLASESTDLFALAISAILDQVASVFNRYAIPRLFALNGFNVEKLPELKPGDLEKPDLEKWSKGLAELVKVGVVRPGLATERRARSLYELPDVEEDDMDEEDEEDRRETQRRANPRPAATQEQANPDDEQVTPDGND